VCTESKGVQHLEVFEGLPQGVRAGVFSRLRVGESSGRIKPSKGSKEAQEVCVVENL
jgi:hypothetical protein